MNPYELALEDAEPVRIVDLLQRSTSMRGRAYVPPSERDELLVLTLRAGNQVARARGELEVDRHPCRHCQVLVPVPTWLQDWPGYCSATCNDGSGSR